jgi:hypothetical protein
MFLQKIQEYEPRTPQRQLCIQCDERVVDSEEKSTGIFTTQMGTSFSIKTGDYNGNSAMVLYALCSHCLIKR